MDQHPDPPPDLHPEERQTSGQNLHHHNPDSVTGAPPVSITTPATETAAAVTTKATAAEAPDLGAWLEIKHLLSMRLLDVLAHT